jgi:hypothetical protein
MSTSHSSHWISKIFQISSSESGIVARLISGLACWWGCHVVTCNWSLKCMWFLDLWQPSKLEPFHSQLRILRIGSVKIREAFNIKDINLTYEEDHWNNLWFPFFSPFCNFTINLFPDLWPNLTPVYLQPRILETWVLKNRTKVCILV